MLALLDHALKELIEEMTRYNLKQFLSELSRRRVFNTILVYIIGAWVALQAADLAFPGLDIPERAIAYVWLGALLLFPLVLVLGWKFDIHVSGIQRTPDIGSESEFDPSLRATDRWLIAGMAGIALIVSSAMLILISRVQPESYEEITSNSIAVLPFA